MVLGLLESPRWLCAHNRPQEALTVLSDLYDMSEDDPMIVKEQTEILRAIQLEQTAKEFSWFQLLKHDDGVRTRHRLLLACFIMSLNQLAGINLIVYVLLKTPELSRLMF